MGPPGGLHYQTVDSICPFSVVVLDRIKARTVGSRSWRRTWSMAQWSVE